MLDIKPSTVIDDAVVSRPSTHPAIMAPPPTNEQKINEAKKITKSEPDKAESFYREVLSKTPGPTEAALRDFENALVGLGELYRDYQRQEDLAELVKTSRSALTSFAKAKTAKLGMSAG